MNPLLSTPAVHCVACVDGYEESFFIVEFRNIRNGSLPLTSQQIAIGTVFEYASNRSTNYNFKFESNANIIIAAQSS